MVTELHDMIGANSVFNDPAKREAYGRDESGLSFDPELVVESDNIKQIQQFSVEGSSVSWLLLTLSD